MESIRTEWQVRCAFNSFCKRVLKHEAINIYYKRRKQQSQETSFSNLTSEEASQLYIVDNYEEDGDTQVFQVAGKEITAKLLELFESISLGNGDYNLNSEGEIVIDD
ncbi:hypothetical protein [Metasolibacillus sp.]|uniref:hypothetical protein n=1 Tax=Metasolibacillus sp. TaxID=2703680 RepID=UPI0025D6BEF9|nr:hypothetical protein [Metasolibacillus sp.]MCT6926284.1 hypothetical protein [Metasolibacillus sp.]MCT6942522.1 hypothetical protein [Metasolibacillus sp.]